MDRSTKIVVPAYLRFVREHPCIVCGLPSTDAHHVKAKGAGSGQRNDYTAVPLCREHHSQLHQYGLTKFEAVNHVNVWQDVAWLLIEWANKEGV